MSRERVVVVGTGWAGFKLSQKLDDKKLDIVVISPDDTCPITPLLASAACGHFDFALAEEPIRYKSRKLTFYKALVEDVDFKKKNCKCRAACYAHDGDQQTFDIQYDRLILAPGCVPNTFNTPGAAEHAYFIRNVNDAKRLQFRVKQLFELASLPGLSDDQQRELLHIIVVGGGPTGIEICAELSDLFNKDFAELYPHLHGKMRLSIHDTAPFILGPFEEALQQHAIGSFRQRNVKIITDSKITEVAADSITTKENGRIGCGAVIWTAGNKQCALVDRLKGVAKTDKLPRIMTDAYLHVLDDETKQPMPDVFALGDAADIKKHFLPTTAEVAVQKAVYLADVINRDYPGWVPRPFEYRQKALVAYIGGNDGVIKGESEWTDQRAWAAWRSKNLLWTESWRRMIMISMYWFMDLMGGNEVARA